MKGWSHDLDSPSERTVWYGVRMKKCKQCKLELPLDRFGPDHRTLDKLNHKCFSCRSLAQPGDTEKRCLVCFEMKPLSDFHRDLAALDLLRKRCKKCGTKAAREWNKQNKDTVARSTLKSNRTHSDSRRAANRKSHLKRTYGITDDDYWGLLEFQGRGCAICGTQPKTKHLHVDHDHKTGKVRGLLCNSCNGRLLPVLEHHPERAAAAFEYLKAPPFATFVENREADSE